MPSKLGSDFQYGVVGARLVDGSRLADGGLHVLVEALLVLHPADQVLAELDVLGLLEDAPVVGAVEPTKLPAGSARRQDHLRLLGERVLLGHHGVVEAGAVVGAHQLARHVGLVVGHVGPAHDARRLDLVLLDGVDRELERGEILLPERRAQRGLAVLVPHAPAVVPEDVLHVAIAVVGAVERLAEAPEVLRRVLALLGHLDDVGVVELGQLDALGVEQILADEETAGEGQPGDAEVLPVDVRRPARRTAGGRRARRRCPWRAWSRRAARPCSASGPDSSSRPCRADCPPRWRPRTSARDRRRWPSPSPPGPCAPSPTPPPAWRGCRCPRSRSS